MRPERWKRLEELYHAALERKPDDRVRFLEAACQGDAALRRELESLIAQDAAAEGFIEEPALEQAARELARQAAGAWVGRQLGGYEVLALLGAGGMGEVYRARDARLGREVALKVLPEEFSQDARRLARFEREARALAALNHPGIATLHGLEESEAARFLVLELVEGETLASRLSRERLSVAECLSLGRQISEALEAAHAKGLIHRDLKPANVMLTAEGRTKLLDFGLARVAEAPAAEPEPGRPQAASGAATSEGLILGTAAYMSPEQARGRPVDRRSDIWSFGCVLYELLTGRRAFRGETTGDILAAVLDRDVDWRALPEQTPAGIRSLLRRCLRKDPNRRLHDIADARIEIEEVLAEQARGAPSAVAPVAGTKSATPRRAAVVGLVAAAAVTAAVVWALRRPPVAPASGVVRLDLDLPADLALARAPFTNPAVVSPDGRTFAFVATSGNSTQLYLRGAESLYARPLPGTEDAQSPFFSPDGRWVGFFTRTALMKASLDGKALVRLCDFATAAEVGIHASWGADETIVFTRGRPPALYRVSAVGGRPQPIPGLESQKGELDYASPMFLPGSDIVLFTARTSGGYEYNAITAFSLATRERRTLIQGGANAQYVSSNHLVYSRGDALLAVAFDPKRLEVAGDPVVVVQDLSYGPNRTGYVSVSRTGVLAYVPAQTAQGTSLVWVDREGVGQPLEIEPRNYFAPSLSPDGTRVALTTTNGKMEIWFLDLDRAVVSRFALEGSNHIGVWTPDGERLAFSSNRAGPDNLFWQAADGSGEAERLSVSDSHQDPASWSPDGTILAFVEDHPETHADIWLLHLEGERWQEPFVRTEFWETEPMISPDGTLLAYSSNESGRFEVYLQPFPGGGRRWRVSTDGGHAPLWARDGKELFFRSGTQLLAVGVETEPAVAFRGPHVLFERATRESSSVGKHDYDVSAAGLFLMVPLPNELPERRIRVVLNWLDELKLRVPTR